MEESKQKKRNKKKKNKPTKAVEDVVLTSSFQEGSDAPYLSHCNGISEFPIEEENGNLGSGLNGSALETKEKQAWIKEEARLKVMIKELQLERESQIQKEAELEIKLSKLQVEKVVLQQKEINFEEKISKLMQEKNTLCMEEINELYAELGHWQAKDRDFAISALDSVNGVDFLAANDNRSDDVLVGEEGLVSGHSKEDYSGVNGKYPATSGCGEIVQIPLDENETRDLEGQALMQEKIDGIPLSDSPLIGAPFRLISFVAKYVSGADIFGDNSNS